MSKVLDTQTSGERDAKGMERIKNMIPSARNVVEKSYLARGTTSLAKDLRSQLILSLGSIAI